MWMLALVLLPLGAGAQTSENLNETPVQVRASAELRLERQLLSLDLLNYNEVRERERRAMLQLTTVLGRMDEAMAGDSLTLGDLETLHNELSVAREAVRTAEGRLEAQLERLQERMRRIGLLEAEAAGSGGVRQLDPVTGRWRLTILPQNATATFDLRLSGTVVSGTYQVDGGTGGSLRGTYSAGNLRLERVDAQGGFDSVWVGVVGENRISGTWQSNELVTGQPTRGDWTALRESGP